MNPHQRLETPTPTLLEPSVLSALRWIGMAGIVGVAVAAWWSPPESASPIDEGDPAEERTGDIARTVFQAELNHATEQELMLMPGIGPKTARAIIRHRNESGPFQSVKDLDRVRGVGPKTIQQIKPYVTVENVDRHHIAGRPAG